MTECIPFCIVDCDQLGHGKILGGPCRPPPFFNPYRFLQVWSLDACFRPVEGAAAEDCKKGSVVLPIFTPLTDKLTYKA